MGATTEQIENALQEEARIEELLEKNREAGIKETRVTRSHSPIIIPSEKFRPEFPFDVV